MKIADSEERKESRTAVVLRFQRAGQEWSGSEWAAVVRFGGLN